MTGGSPFEKLDPLLQHKVRFGTCVLLSNTKSLSFTKLKEALSATDGNLGAQLTKLEEHKYLKVTKEFIKRKPVTWYSLTKTGETSLNKHLDALQEIIDVRNPLPSPTPTLPYSPPLLTKS